MDPTDPTTGVDEFARQPESLVDAVAALNRAIDNLIVAVSNEVVDRAIARIEAEIDRVARKGAD